MFTKKINIITFVINVLLLGSCFGMDRPHSYQSAPPGVTFGMQHPPRRSVAPSSGSDSDAPSVQSMEPRSTLHQRRHASERFCEHLDDLGDDVCCMCHDAGRCIWGAGMFICGTCGVLLNRNIMIDNVGLDAHEQVLPGSAEVCCLFCGALAMVGCLCCLASLTHRCCCKATVREASLEFGCHHEGEEREARPSSPHHRPHRKGGAKED